MRPATLVYSILAASASLAPLVSLAGAGTVTSTITEREVRAHLDFLASDLLEGRDSGYRGGEVAAAYIEAHLAARGFRPLFESFQMPFELRGAAGRAKVTLRAGASEHSQPSEVEALALSGLGDVRAPLVTRDGDPAGRIVVVAADDEAEKLGETAQGFFDRGAKGVVFVSAKEKLEARARRDGRRRAVPKPRAPDAATQSAPDAPAAQGGGWLAAHAPLAETALASLAGPVVRVARDLGPDLLARVDDGGEAEIIVTRDGVDRSTNIIGVLPGSDPQLDGEYVVIGAHYDHVGLDDQGNIWNGADDNGSGTVAVLEVADALAQMPEPPKRSVVVCLWGAEERGLVGSVAFVRTKRLPAEKIAAYVNLDMVSRNDSGSIFGLHASKDLFDLAVKCGAENAIEVTTGAQHFLSASDSGPFIGESVPTLFFFCGLHDQYHTPADDPGTVDYGKITRVARTAFDMITSLAGSATRPRFEETEPERPASENRRRLGIFPEDAAKGDGVTVRAVSGKSVAAQAGLKAADRIVKIGDKSVTDMASMREALNAQPDGTAFKIEVVRDGQPVVVEATFEKKT